MPKKTAEQLRAEAKELLRKANELENAEAVKIGRKLLAYRSNLDALTLDKVKVIIEGR